jgi:hypothetical protein
MVISIAMLGIGSAGTVLAVLCGKAIRPKKGYYDTPAISERVVSWILSESGIAIHSLLTGASLILSYIVSNYIPFDPVKFSWDNLQFFYLALYCLVLSIPFFFSGILLAIAFFLYSDRSMILYSFNLTGAGLGALTALGILNIEGPEYAVLTASILCLAGAVIAGKRLTRTVSLIFIIINMLVVFLHPDFIRVKISPYKNLPLFLKYPGAEHLKTYHSAYSRIDTFKSPAIRFAPGLSFKYLEELPEQIGIAIDGHRVDVITGVQDKGRLKFLEFLPPAVVYETWKKDRALIVDPKGGLHVLLARYYGTKEIHKIESNPLLVKIIRNEFNDFSGKIFHTQTRTGYARNFLRKLSQNSRYELIDLPLTGVSVTGIFGISEDYKYTVEAFKQYLGALTDDGILAISLYLIQPPRTEFRILSTLISAFKQNGVDNISTRVAAIRSWDSMTIIVKKSPLTVREIKKIKEFSESRRFDLVYYPGIREEETNRYVKLYPDKYLDGFKRLLDPATYSLFINNYLFDIKPVYDENPFFHYYLKLANVKEIYHIMGQKWLYFIEEGYLLPVVFIIVFILCLITILVPAFFRSVSGDNHSNLFRQSGSFSLISSLLFFAMLGIGFMFVEVSLIQKSILLLENPSYSLASVLTSILISSGIGSMFSERFSRLRSAYSLLIIAVLIFSYSLIFPLLLNLSSFEFKTRVIICSIFFAPLGFFMGIPFPMGLKILGQQDRSLIPWAWAVNATLSVLAPVMSIMIAITIGFTYVLWLGSLAYLLAFILLKRFGFLSV